MIKNHGSAAPLQNRPPLIAIALVSASALAYEILLMRLFSIIQWHHFAYMIISIALLGYGASGTFVTIFQEKLLLHFRRNFICLVLLFSVASSSCFLTAQHIQFNAQEVLWDASQLSKLFLIYLLLVLPFFFAASAIAITLLQFRQKCGAIYAADLIGAGCGSVFIIVLLYLVFPASALLIIASLGSTAAGIAIMELQNKSPTFIIAIGLIFLVHFLLPGKFIQPAISPYKGLPQALQIKGTSITEQRSSPLGLISVVESPVIPWRHAPGMSINASIEPPEQLALFSDADSMTVLTKFNGDYGTVAYLDQQTSALAYHLRPIKRALIIGTGGGSGLLQAGFHQVEHIDSVEINPQIIAIGQDNKNFSGSIFDNSKTKVHIAEARGFVSQTTDRFDIIQVELLDSFNASAAGLYALHESYLYTVEALQQYIQTLSPEGYLSISRWVKVPPRDSLKLFATALAALESKGSDTPEKHLILIRGWQASTLLIKNGVINEDEIKALKKFCRERSFDLAYYPGMSEKEANQYNLLKEPYFYQGAQALFSEKADFLQRYKFNLAPATDNRPYFNHFLKASTFPEIIRLRGKGGLPLMEGGYLILLATLVQAVSASIVLILLPLKLQERPTYKGKPTFYFHVFLYFSAIGLGFIFLEIAFIQKFLLFLHHPLFATSVVVSSFLVFAGMGSACTKRLLQRYLPEKILRTVLGLLLIQGVLYIPLFDQLVEILLRHTILVKILVSILLIAPLAFCMGMPFPLALNSLSRSGPALIPWAWGVNGYASVISAVLAMLLAINFGFTAVIITALIFYGIAFYAFSKFSGENLFFPFNPGK